MQRIQLNQDIRPLSEFRANVAAFIEQVHKTSRPLVITNHGKTSAILMNPAEYEALIEKVELMQDIMRAEADIAAGRVYTQEEVEKRVRKLLKKK